MSPNFEILTETEISELSSAIKSDLNKLTYNAEFDPTYKPSRNTSKFVKLSGVAAAVTAVLAYSLIGNSSVSPAWSDTPIAIGEATQNEILNSCASLLPVSATQPTIHLTDYRGTFGNAVIGTMDADTSRLRSWNCNFTKTESESFKAIEINETKFISPEYTHTGTLVYPSAHSGSSTPIYEQIVWNGGGVIDGVQIPASQLFLGTFSNGTYSVKVNCPGIPESTASISHAESGIFSIWVPSNSSECSIVFLDKSGKELPH